jgi:single-strand DNA-binding protein
LINNTVLVGRLTKDPDLRYTANGTAVASFTLAVNRNFKSKDGEREADFINCVIWRKSAESIAKMVRKGSLIGVVGRIQTRNYENQQGQRVYVTEVVADNFQMLESKAASEKRQQTEGGSFDKQNSAFPQTPSKNETPSFAKEKDSYSGADSAAIDISDDDLPF